MSGVDTISGVNPSVAVSGLTVARGGREVLTDLSLTVAPGTVTGLLGPSGSGKTTLMRALVGVQRVAAGEVTVLGRPAGSASLRPLVGYVTQAPSIYGDLTIQENLDYFARILDAGSGRLDAVVKDVDLDARRRQLVRDLSGGERARVSLASALLNQPPLLILDEPTVGLDPLLRRDLWALFHRLARTGTTLLVSSHVMDEAGHCDNLLLLRGGRLVFDGSPEQLRADTGKADLSDAFLALIEGVG